MVFLAGHGFRGDRQEYYFLPHDGNPEEPEVTAVRDFEIRDFLSKVAGKTLLFLDTCHSGGLRPGRGPTDALPDVTKFANELADADAGVIVFASSTGRERALELDAFQHGAFTQALLEGIGGAADYNNLTRSYRFVRTGGLPGRAGQGPHQGPAEAHDRQTGNGRGLPRHPRPAGPVSEDLHATHTQTPPKFPAHAHRDGRWRSRACSS